MAKAPEEMFTEGLKALFDHVAKLPEGERRKAEIQLVKLTGAFQNVHDRMNELDKHAKTDPLTGLPNRAGIMMELHGRLESMRRYGDKSVAVVFLDLDGFKQVNDHCGHDVGDRALKETGARLQQAFRDTDTVGRLGGDEMVMLFTYDQGERFSEETVRAKVREAMRGLIYEHNGGYYPVGASIGAAYLTADDMPDRQAITPEDIDKLGARLIKEADQNMYLDKPGKEQRLEAAKAEGLKQIASSAQTAARSP